MTTPAASLALMPFLERLAPGAQQGQARIRAALAPRFASEWTSLAEETTLVFAHEPAAQQVRSSAPPVVPPVAAAKVVAVETPARDPQYAVPMARPPNIAAPVRFATAPVKPAPATGRHRTNATTEPALTPPMRAPVHAVAALAQPAESRPPRDTADAAPAQPPTHPDHRAPRPPLTESAVAQRAAQVRSEPTVVHVTIDRIDVRAPAQAPEPALAPKPRATSTLPLSDYLRQRGREPQAGGRP
ncbi:MAG TPA: hypothetical protein VFR86_16805 [Burkholderiaceae bacterium]|nr:hypothetical protein [Burkholderiaceae bacterium]